MSIAVMSPTGVKLDQSVAKPACKVLWSPFHALAEARMRKAQLEIECSRRRNAWAAHATEVHTGYLVPLLARSGAPVSSAARILTKLFRAPVSPARGIAARPEALRLPPPRFAPGLQRRQTHCNPSDEHTPSRW